MTKRISKNMERKEDLKRRKKDISGSFLWANFLNREQVLLLVLFPPPFKTLNMI